jgi:type II secretory pathway predicted ATPase ExeA
MNDEGLVKVSGEVGSGKTMLCRMLLERLPQAAETIYLANPTLTRDELLAALCDELGIVPENARPNALLKQLQEHLLRRYTEGRRVIILVDEAHAMPAESLEQIRLLSNLESSRHKLLQIVLFGQPELDQILARPDMRQLKDRIGHHFRLAPMSRQEVAAYIEHRMRSAGYRGPNVFSGSALKLITRASQGLTRRVNLLADKCLLAAFAANRHAVGRGEARAAIRDADLARRRPLWFWLLPAGAGLVAVLVAVAVAGLPRERAAGALPVPPAAPPAAANGAPHIAAVGDGTPAAAPPPAAPPVSGSTPATVLPAPAQAPAPATADATGIDALLAASAPWLAAANDEHWFIQLLTADGARASEIDAFIARARALPDGAPLRAYTASVNGRPRIGVIWGEFATQREALDALATLPEALRAHGAFPRQIRRLR